MGKRLDKIVSSAGPLLAAALIRGLRLTMRLEFVGYERYRAHQKEKKTYLKSVFMASTMSPAIAVDTKVLIH